MPRYSRLYPGWEPPNDNHITKSALKQRGWTEGAIEQFLGEPDIVKPKSRGKGWFCLFNLDRIKAAEETPEFIAWREKKEKLACGRRFAGYTTAQKHREKLMAEVDALGFDVVELDVDEVENRAISEYNDYQLARNNLEGWAHPNSDEAFLARITVNYIRHSLTNYDAMMQLIHGRAGKEIVREYIYRRIFGEIMTVYPELEQEAKVQLQKHLYPPTHVW
jgi:hypothetical protein